MKRKPSSSPVCYAGDKDIDPAYMWAQPKLKTKSKTKRGATKRAIRSAKR